MSVLGIVDAGEPRGSGAVLDSFAFPGLRSRFAGRRDGPETPYLFAGFLIERRDQSARAFFAAGGSGND